MGWNASYTSLRTKLRNLSPSRAQNFYGLDLLGTIMLHLSKYKKSGTKSIVYYVIVHSLLVHRWIICTTGYQIIGTYQGIRASVIKIPGKMVLWKTSLRIKVPGKKVLWKKDRFFHRFIPPHNPTYSKLWKTHICGPFSKGSLFLGFVISIGNESN